MEGIRVLKNGVPVARTTAAAEPKARNRKVVKNRMRRDGGKGKKAGDSKPGDEDDEKIKGTKDKTDPPTETTSTAITETTPTSTEASSAPTTETTSTAIAETTSASTTEAMSASTTETTSTSSAEAMSASTTETTSTAIAETTSASTTETMSTTIAETMSASTTETTSPLTTMSTSTTLATSTTSSSTSSRAQSTSSSPSTTNDQQQAQVTVPLRAGGLASTASASPTAVASGAHVHHGMSHIEVAAVVFAAISGVLVAAFILWFCMRMQRKRIEKEFETEDERKMREEGIWGEAIAVRSDVEITSQEYIPAFMQRGGVHDPSGALKEYGMSEEVRPSRSFNAAGDRQTLAKPPMARVGGQTRMGDDGLIQPPIRWFKRDSVASVVKFMDVKSWTNDQTGRMNNRASKWSATSETEPNIPRGRYNNV